LEEITMEANHEFKENGEWGIYGYSL
jgi:hypothetical protein